MISLYKFKTDALAKIRFHIQQLIRGNLTNISLYIQPKQVL